MSFPRKKSRGITVDGERFRWMVSTVDAEHLQRIRVEAEHGQGGVLVILRRVYSARDQVPVTPLEIRARVQRARRTGWDPHAPGPERLVDEAGWENRVLPPEAYARDDRRLQLRCDTAPLRTRYPWPSLHNVVLDFIVQGGLTEHQAGALLSEMAAWLELEPGEDLSATWGPWLDGPRGRRRPYIHGGVELVWDGALRLRAGCCAKASDAWEWLQLLDLGQVSWNGHDPFSGATRVPEGVRFEPGERCRAALTVSAEDYGILSAALRRDLSQAKQALLQFTRAQGLSAARRVALAAALDRTLGLVDPQG